MTSSIHQVIVAEYVHLADSIDVDPSVDPIVENLGPFSADDTGVETLHIYKTIYLTAPYIGILLGSDITPVEAWK